MKPTQPAYAAEIIRALWSREANAEHRHRPLVIRVRPETLRIIREEMADPNKTEIMTLNGTYPLMEDDSMAEAWRLDVPPQPTPRPRDVIASEQAQAFYAIGVKEAQIRILRGEIDALHAQAQELNREAAASDTAPNGAAPAGAEGTR